MFRKRLHFQIIHVYKRQTAPRTPKPGLRSHIQLHPRSSSCRRIAASRLLLFEDESDVRVCKLAGSDSGVIQGIDLDSRPARGLGDHKVGPDDGKSGGRRKAVRSPKQVTFDMGVPPETDRNSHQRRLGSEITRFLIDVGNRKGEAKVQKLVRKQREGLCLGSRSERGYLGGQRISRPTGRYRTSSMVSTGRLHSIVYIVWNSPND